MPEEFPPGLFFVIATLLPLASFVILLLWGGLRWALRPARDSDPTATAFNAIGGNVGGPGPAYVATAAIAIACGLCITGFVFFLMEHRELHATHEEVEREIKGVELAISANAAEGKEIADQLKPDRESAPGKKLEKGQKTPEPKGGPPLPGKKLGKGQKAPEPKEEPLSKEERAKLMGEAKENAAKNHELHAKVHKLQRAIKDKQQAFDLRWSGSVLWASVLPHPRTSTGGEAEIDTGKGTELYIGYRIDMLAALMFVMVTLIATMIHLFSMGYMADELQPTYEDHEVHAADGHFRRRGRFGRFFMFLSLFCFSMLNLLLADNLFQIFVSWELVGVCSFLLVGFYFERQSASNAANKAFITNRVGDAGFLIGLMILWTYVGTFNFEELFARLRAPEHDAHHELVLKHHIVTADRGEALQGGYEMHVRNPQDGVAGSDVVIFPRNDEHIHFGHGDAERKPWEPERWEPVEVEAYDTPGPRQYGHMPYWLLTIAGLGLFLGCVGKSAQFPLHVWLPDAMEGPTPVSALIHAATMVAAGVYLVARVYPLFTPEVLLVIAYTGAITLFVAATVAIVMTDIKKVLAYSTVSQLGYMMLALGVGGWVAGSFHLITHAFFKALLFLCSGSVIYGCHHQQDMLKMGGLYPKMKITAITMLIGVLAICGVPIFAGYYSKDAILVAALAYASFYKQHALLFILPLITAALTTFYMFRMWFMTFTGRPRDHHVHEHAHESPWLITVPLIVLACFSTFVAWGLPPWDTRDYSIAESQLATQLEHSQPPAVYGDLPKPVVDEVLVKESGGLKVIPGSHRTAGALALLMVLLGVTFAWVIYYKGLLDPADAKEQFPGVHRFLTHKWWFDEFYSAAIVRPGLTIAGWARAFDTYVVDGIVHFVARVGLWTSRWSGSVDRGVVDGLVNVIANVSYAIGAWLRTFQTGYLRSYVLFLALAAIAIWFLLMSVWGVAVGGP